MLGSDTTQLGSLLHRWSQESPTDYRFFKGRIKVVKEQVRWE